MTLTARLQAIRERSNAMHSEVITDPQSPFWYKVAASQGDIPFLLEALEKAVAALGEYRHVGCDQEEDAFGDSTAGNVLAEIEALARGEK